MATDLQVHRRPTSVDELEYFGLGAAMLARKARERGRLDDAEHFTEQARRIQRLIAADAGELQVLVERQGKGWFVLGIDPAGAHSEGLPFRCQPGCYCNRAQWLPWRKVYSFRIASAAP